MMNNSSNNNNNNNSTSREAHQQRVYYYLAELRLLLGQTPTEARLNLPEELLVQLAHVLAGGRVFDIVAELAESQRLEEFALHRQLADLRVEQSAERAAMRRRHREEHQLVSSSRPHHLPVLEREQALEQQAIAKRQAEIFHNLTSHIVDVLDGRVVQQQTELVERAGLSALFTPTTSSPAIRVQMRLLDWIMRLSQRRHPGSPSPSNEGPFGSGVETGPLLPAQSVTVPCPTLNPSQLWPS